MPSNYYGETVWQNAQILYAALENESELVTADRLVPYGYPSDGPETRVFFGVAQRVGEKVGLSKSSHAHATTLLRAMRSIENVSGPGFTSSVYILHYKPNEDHYNKYKVTRADVGQRIAPSNSSVIKHDLADARVRIKALEANMKTANEKAELLTQALKDLQTQFVGLMERFESGRNNV